MELQNWIHLQKYQSKSTRLSFDCITFTKNFQFLLYFCQAIVAKNKSIVQSQLTGLQWKIGHTEQLQEMVMTLQDWVSLSRGNNIC